ncbi:MAG: NAD+ synthase [bacterium]|nr:NAD+ synthase [bacterium]
MKEQIIIFLREYLAGKKAIIGLSGGIDSTVVAYLLAEAIGSNNILGLILPSNISKKSDVKDALNVCNELKIDSKIINIQSIIDEYKKTTPIAKKKNVSANLQPRIRMSLLYAYAASYGGLVVGTGNKSELLTGYFTKHGDGGVDLLPIGNLYKTQVFELASQIGVSEKIIIKKPSAGLLPGQSDEKELGLTYTELDDILMSMESKKPLVGFNPQHIQRVMELYSNAQHKLTLPPIPKVL